MTSEKPAEILVGLLVRSASLRGVVDLLPPPPLALEYADDLGLVLGAPLAAGHPDHLLQGPALVVDRRDVSTPGGREGGRGKMKMSPELCVLAHPKSLNKAPISSPWNLPACALCSAQVRKSPLELGTFGIF